jgi:predicted metal-dependent enzyme (double-stranded beta helix superfamily)
MAHDAAITVRQYARRLIEVLDQPRNGQEFRDAITDLMGRLLERPDLLTLGVERSANHQPWSSYLYYDGELTVAMSNIAVSRAVPVHDHGVVWEAVAVYRGALNHRIYRRAAEETDEGRAKLELVEDAVLGMGDLRALEPPDDIHGLIALEEDTYLLGAHLGQFAVNRRYYQPDRGTYLWRSQRQWRSSSS